MSSPSTDASPLARLRDLPKAEVHVHLEGRFDATLHDFADNSIGASFANAFVKARLRAQLALWRAGAMDRERRSASGSPLQ